eukprot:TRINITY_DN14950_c0_g1_i1.p1 TRINITY_DN14950_c0_g1~~TRINITY_DN14950_c0_g1_i1.p1  ORF type:complete len:317 (-),score=75.96 TRINITY_DN14950_c0_g1_i1:79-1029(-)
MASVSSVTLTKMNGSLPPSSTFRVPSVPMLTIRPVNTKSGKSSSLSSYLRTVIKACPDDGKSPSVESIGESKEEDNHELPPGTKIITHPLNTSRGYNDTTIVTKKASGYEESMNLNEIVKKLKEGRCSKSSEEAEAENQNADSKEYQRQTLAQMEKVKQLEEELAKEQSRLQAMISHLQVEGLEKDQKSASKTYLFSQPASNNRNLIDEIYPRTVKDDPKYNVDIGFELSKKGDFYRTQDVRPPFTYAALIKQALSEAPNNQMSLNEIYSWFSTSFAFYRHNPHSWKNAVRHNLSLHSMFRKVENMSGSVWSLEEM